MIVTGWNNGDHKHDGNGYGLKITPSDRDLYFRREWRTILLEMDGVTRAIEINLDKKSFWNISCRELISVHIGKWLIKNKLAPWLKGNPPQLELTQIDGRRFKLSAQ